MIYESTKNLLKRNKFIRLLTAVVAGTASAFGCAYLTEKDADELSAADTSLVAVNKGLRDADQKVAVRATEAGIAGVAALPPAAPKEAKGPAPVFEIQKGIAVPEIKRGGGARAEIYPFATMEQGDSFFVAATADKANPAKALASTVSSATKRFATPTGEQETVTIKGKPVTRPKMKINRKFVVRAVEENGSKGARIWRTA